jgi:hypothetical protein
MRASETDHEPGAFQISRGKHEHMLGCDFMDNERFDALTRGLGARSNRRTALRWLGAAALTAAGVRRATEAAAAQATPGGYGDPCEQVAGSCQAPYTCFEAICDLPRGCVGEGQPCVDDFPCCEDEGTSCIDGICAVAAVHLPDTGVGLPDDTSRVAGLGLAAAAVLVAGKLIRDKERDHEL